MIHFGRAICGDLAQAESREWWLSNGLGGYAAGTIAGSLTRRYHGLLITPLDNALDRHLVFAKAEPTLEIDGQFFPLSCNRWQSGAIAPRGYMHIESFQLSGQLPVWVYSVAGVRLQQRIFMEQGEAAVWVAFRLLDPLPEPPVHLHLRLLVNQRDHHGQTSSDGLNPETQLVDKYTLQLSYTDTSQLHIQLDSGELQVEDNWINDIQLPRERERGLPDLDNHLAIAQARLTLNNQWHGVRAGLHPGPQPNPSIALRREQLIQYNFLNTVRRPRKKKAPVWIDQLILNTQSFVFHRQTKEGAQKEDTEEESVIAGYPWFADWGRDTMIALPGLTLTTGQLPLARQILETWSAYVDQGMVPNRFPESATSTTSPEYNSVDASLWFILAWFAYLQAGGEEIALRNVLPVLQQIINAYHHGTRYQIHMDESSGLLHIGETGTQLTWMDARVNGIAATPRTGKPVEVNALWYNVLMAMQNITDRLGGDAGDPDNGSSTSYAAMAERTRHGFQQYLRPEGGLYDVLDTPDGNDASIRPNQIFALSLPWSLLDKKEANAVLDEIHKHLYTSYGLRSLSPQDTSYRGIYQGSVAERDSAYHNGPVWGWLLGH